MADIDTSILFSKGCEKPKQNIDNSLAVNELITNEYSLEPEIYDGNTEYKLMIKPDNKRKTGLAVQMGWRLREGNEHAIYWLGIKDNGYALGTIKSIMDESIKHLTSIAESIGAKTTILSLTNIGNNVENLGIDMNKFYCTVMGYTLPEEGDIQSTVIVPPDRYIASIEVISCKSKVEYETITMGVMGNVNAGKSTLIGTLVTGDDDGRGKNRTHVFNHVHEILSGRTSHVNHIIFGYQPNGNIKYYDPCTNWSIITKESNKIIKFFDLAGHEKYFKTTIKGLTHNRPNYVIITVEATKGVTDMTKQHITLCRARLIPFIILITKVDIVNRKKYTDTVKSLGSLLKTHFQLMANPICDIDDAIRVAEQLHHQIDKPQTITKGQITTSNLVPIIDVSCVTGEGLDLLKKVIHRLKPNSKYNPQEQVEFYLETIFDKVHGVGLVISGLLTSGTVEQGQQLNIGPDINGKYVPVKIKSIHVDQQLVTKVTAGHHCSFALSSAGRKKIELKQFVQKDMVILDDLIKPIAYKSVKIHIKMLNIQKLLETNLKKITLRVNSKFIMQFNNIRRAVVIKSIEKINKNIINEGDEAQIFPGDTARVTIMLDTPAYIKKRDMCVLTESHMFGMGIINDIVS